MKFKSILFILFAMLMVIDTSAKEKKKSKKVLAQEATTEALVKPFRDKAAALEAEVTKLKEDNNKMLADINVLNEENKSLQAEAMQIRKKEINPLYIEYLKWIDVDPNTPRVPQVVGSTAVLNQLK